MIKRFETKLLVGAFEFIEKQKTKAIQKIFQNIKRAEIQYDLKFFKKFTNEICLFRTLITGIQYRFLVFWDKENKANTIVFASHGIIKKRSKVDMKEITKVEKIRKTYFKNKNK